MVDLIFIASSMFFMIIASRFRDIKRIIHYPVNSMCHVLLIVFHSITKTSRSDTCTVRRRLSVLRHDDINSLTRPLYCIVFVLQIHTLQTFVWKPKRINVIDCIDLVNVYLLYQCLRFIINIFNKILIFLVLIYCL